MQARTRRTLVGLVALIALGVVLLLMRSGRGERLAPRQGEDEAPLAEGASSGAAAVPGARAGAPGKQGPAKAGASTSPRRQEVLAEFGWGSGPSELGRMRPQEANPEAPMSMAVDAQGNLVVLDQVNGRLVRLDAKGQAVGSVELTQQTPQDVTLARDGTALVLDRLRDRTVALIDPDTGRPLGELPVGGKGIPEPGLVTGVFVDGESIYVEREHGALVRIGDLSGNIDPERPEIPGRPTRDGRSFILAGIVDPQAGRLFVNAVDRQTGQHRYTREYRLQFPVMSITLLDTDLSGVIHLGVAGELPTGKADPASQLGVRLFCLDPLDGKVLGQTDLPINTLPEETFRDFSVLDQGGVVYRYISESGVTLMRASCR